MGPENLIGLLVRLEPLHPDHAVGLVTAAADGPFEFTSVPRTLREACLYVKNARSSCREGACLGYAVIEKREGHIIGSSRFRNMVRWIDTPDARLANPDVVEIGESWIAAGYRKPELDLEGKLLMLRHAFESWGVRRVSFEIDTLNHLELETVENIGATCEGVLRAHSLRLDGTVRSVAAYSILDTEWERVRDAVAGRLPRLAPSLTRRTGIGAITTL